MTFKTSPKGFKSLYLTENGWPCVDDKNCTMGPSTDKAGGSLHSWVPQVYVENMTCKLNKRGK